MAFDTNRLSDIESDAGSETSEDKGVGGDAQTLASLLQQQIDVINKELRWVVIVLLLLALKAQILTMFVPFSVNYKKSTSQQKEKPRSWKDLQ